MAINALLALKLVKHLKAHPGARIASMGYPDVIAPAKLIDDLTAGCLQPLSYRVDSDQICKRHGLVTHRPIPDADSFVGLFGGKLEVFDIARERGTEIQCDLNEPLDEALREQYDVVIDGGTLEHCFNIGQAALNIASMLKAGGIIFHENPFNWGNHGFYGLNPTWYGDFYGQPGFVLHDMRLLKRDGKQVKLEGDERFWRFLWGEGEANCYAMAERTEVLPIKWPTQTKYKGA